MEQGRLVVWFEGGLQVSGDQNAMILNLRDPRLLVLITLHRKSLKIYRVPYERLIGFELIFEGEESKEIVNRFFPN